MSLYDTPETATENARVTAAAYVAAGTRGDLDSRRRDRLAGRRDRSSVRLYYTYTVAGPPRKNAGRRRLGHRGVPTFFTRALPLPFRWYRSPSPHCVVYACKIYRQKSHFTTCNNIKARLLYN